MRRVWVATILLGLGSCAMSDRAEAPSAVRSEGNATSTVMAPGAPAEPEPADKSAQLAEPSGAMAIDAPEAFEAKPVDDGRDLPKPSVESGMAGGAERDGDRLANAKVVVLTGGQEGVIDELVEQAAMGPRGKIVGSGDKGGAAAPGDATAEMDDETGFDAGSVHGSALGTSDGVAYGGVAVARRAEILKKQQAPAKQKTPDERLALDDAEVKDDGARFDAAKAEAAGRLGGEDTRQTARPRSARPRSDAQALVADSDLALDLEPEPPAQFQKPEHFLPRMAYFENTYLGGNAAHQQMVRRLERDISGADKPWQQAYAAPQPFDPPTEQALALSATLDRRWVDGEGPVYLQIGVQGSRRYGWRRPPLDVVLVVDGPVLAAGTEATDELVGALLRSLGPQDRLGVVIAGARVPVVSEVEPVKELRTALAERLQRAGTPTDASPASLEHAIDVAGGLLQTAAQAQARVPGSQVTLVAVAGEAPDGELRAQRAAAAAHRLTLQGAMTSIVELGTAPEGPYWQVAAAGHGNYHRAAAGEERDVVTTELELLAKVVARLLRINIRLAPGAHAVRILGSRVLGAEQVRQVKAREVATDRNLSRTLGVTADRGEDDDGLQTVIPYYYGGDSHVILVELWVDGPGAVADVTLRYKDMVTLDNATARTSVSLGATPRPPLPEQLLVRRNLQGFALADALRGASAALSRNDSGGAMTQLNRANRYARGAADAQVIEGFSNLVRESAGDPEAAEPVWRALGVAARQRVGLQRR